MIASVLDWAAERFQDALGSADLDPGLVHASPTRSTPRGARPGSRSSSSSCFGIAAEVQHRRPRSDPSRNRRRRAGRPGRERVRA